MMADMRVEINSGSSPVKVENNGCGHGLALMAISMSAVFGSFALISIAEDINKANQLTERELNIQQQRLELDRQRYALDSLQYFNNIKQR